jgi:hypothetical protein
MTTLSAVTEERVRRFIAAWFVALDIHAPIEECYAFLTEQGLHMSFPDGEIRDFDSFKQWYTRVTHLFFDEQHNVNSVTLTTDEDRVVVDVVVGWQASWVEPAAAKSKRTSMDATQRWVLRASSKNTYGLEITEYNATAAPFKFAPGFARL